MLVAGVGNISIDSLDLNRQLGERMFQFLQLGFDGCTSQFRAAYYPPSGESNEFLDTSSQVLEKIP